MLFAMLLSNAAFCYVIYLKCVGYNKAVDKFMQGKFRVVLTSQARVWLGHLS